MCKFFERLESEGSRCEDGIYTGQVVTLPIVIPTPFVNHI